MDTTALIFVNAPSKDDPDLPRSHLQVGGITLLERQLRQLKRLGFEKVRLVTKNYKDMFQRTLFSAVPENIEILDHLDAKATHFWLPDEKVLVLEEGVLIDERIMKAVLESKKKAKRKVAIFPTKTVIYGKGLGLKLQDTVAELLFASVALVRGADVMVAAGETSFASNPLKTLLKGALGTGKAAYIDVSVMPTYLPDRRRDVPILWRPIAEKSETGKGTRALIATAQKGVLDWPARWIHPLFENPMVEFICPTPITPNMVTVLTFVVGLYIAWLFFTGQMLWALVGVLVIGILDGVDGKLARTKMLQSRIGELEHIADKIVEYLWYFAIAGYLSAVEGNALPWALAVIIVLFAWAEVVQGEFFRRLTGKQLDDAGDFERKFRIIGGRRNTQFWALIPFALTNQWLLGFWFVAIYAAVTFFVAQARFIIRVREYGSDKSLEIKKNFDDTAYF